MSFLKIIEKLFSAVARSAPNVMLCGIKLLNLLNETTPLHFAALKDYDEVVDVLLNNNPNAAQVIEMKAKYGNTSLHYAVMNGHIKIIKNLLQRGANVNVKNHIGYTPLHIAASCNQPEAAKVLLDFGADGNLADNNNNTPLHLAAQTGRNEVINILLENNSNAAQLIEAEGECGNTPLHYAVTNNHIETIKNFLQRGANVNAKNNVGSTPLQTAASCNQSKVTKILLDFGADENLADNDNNTPLHLAAHMGRNKVINILLKNNPNATQIIEAKNHWGNTPLFCAVQNAHVSTVKLLIQMGADPQAANIWNKDALWLAAAQVDTTLITLLALEGTEKEGYIDENKTQRAFAATQNRYYSLIPYSSSPANLLYELNIIEVLEKKRFNALYNNSLYYLLDLLYQPQTQEPDSCGNPSVSNSFEFTYKKFRHKDDNQTIELIEKINVTTEVTKKWEIGFQIFRKLPVEIKSSIIGYLDYNFPLTYTLEENDRAVRIADRLKKNYI